MSVIDPSMQPMLEMFIYETTTLLDQLDEILLSSEKSKTISGDNINEIFRIMHTIKGSAAMMGLESISSLAHAVEDVFFIIREEPARMQQVSEAIFDLVFQASDFFKAEVEQVQSDDYQPSDSAAMIAELKRQAAIMKGEAQPDAPSAPEVPAQAAEAPQAPAPAGDGWHQVRVYFEDGCQMENLRAYMLLTHLKDWCDELTSEPEHPENDGGYSEDIIKNGFLIRFKGKVEDVYKAIEGSTNVKSYEPIEESAQAAPVEIPAPPPSAAPADVSGQPTQAVGQSVAAPAPAAVAAAVQAPAATAQPAATQAKPVSTVTKQSLISVNQSKLDQLMDLVGELVTTESMVVSNPDLKGLVLDSFFKSTRELRKLTDELQDVVMSIRMVPLSGVFQKMNRIVRDMCKKLDKKAELVAIGGETEVDKTIIDSITDPFMHMVRNSMDHAIEMPEERVAKGKPETGTVTMSAQNVGGEIVIKIADDGAGLNAQKIMEKAKNNGLLTKPENEYTDKEIFHMIMLAGFSTNDQVTEFSGRGVGMDVVRKNLEKVGGTIKVESEKDVGTTFIIKIPLTLAIVDGMEISVGGTSFIIPITSITQSFKIFDPQQVIHDTDGAEMIMLRGECYPIVRLHDFFGIPTQITDLTEGILIQCESSHRSICIFADELLGEQQVVVKPFPVYLNSYDVKGSGLSGCTILGDGSISLIVDIGNMTNAFER